MKEICPECTGAGKGLDIPYCKVCGGTGKVEVKEKTAENCQHCGVPNDLHGTCCGWGNANHPCSAGGVITDQRHPGFGQPLNLWIHTFYDFSSNADACDISAASGYGSGWKDGIAYASSVASLKNKELEERLRELENAVEPLRKLFDPVEYGFNGPRVVWSDLLDLKRFFEQQKVDAAKSPLIKLFVNGFAFLVEGASISKSDLCKLVLVPNAIAVIYREESNDPESPLATSFKIKDGDRFSIIRQWLDTTGLKGSQRTT